MVVSEKASSQDEESAIALGENPLDSGLAQVIGVAILEFGVLFHSVLIGLTLAVDPQFKILFVVIVFHRKFINFSLLFFPLRSLKVLTVVNVMQKCSKVSVLVPALLISTYQRVIDGLLMSAPSFTDVQPPSVSLPASEWERPTIQTVLLPRLSVVFLIPSVLEFCCILVLSRYVLASFFLHWRTPLTGGK